MMEQRRENGRVFGAGIVMGCFFLAVREVRKPPVKPAREDFAAEELRVLQDVAEKPCIGFDPRDGVFRKGAFQARDRLRAVATPRNELAEQRIVFRRDREALVDAIIEPNSGARGCTARNNGAG